MRLGSVFMHEWRKLVVAIDYDVELDAPVCEMCVCGAGMWCWLCVLCVCVQVMTTLAEVVVRCRLFWTHIDLNGEVSSNYDEMQKLYVGFLKLHLYIYYTQ